MQSDILVPSARRRLLSWYRRHGRHDMPWRKTRDPYRVLVSEMMLQQTTVATVLPYYRRFLKLFPTIQSLAKARSEKVLAAWSGLGYYARARHLHEAARIVVERYQGRVPEELEELRTLPGIGRYTAGAVRSLAFGQPAPILDGNVIRVLSRLLGIREDVRSKPVQERLWSHAEQFADCPQARDVNLALFDLGATVCKPVEAMCGICPLSALCKARASGMTERIPLKVSASERKAVTWLVPLISKNSQVLMGLRGNEGLFAGLWEFPALEAARGTSPVERLEKGMKIWGLWAKVEESLPAVSHTLTHRDFTMNPYLCRWLGGPSSGADPMGRYVRFKWVHPQEVKRMAVSTLTHKITGLLTP